MVTRQAGIADTFSTAGCDPGFRAGSSRRFILQVAQRALRFDFLLRDIGMGAEPADQVAAVVANRQLARQELAKARPALRKGKRVCPWPPGCETVLKALENAIDTIGMVNLAPAPSCHFLRRAILV